MGITSLSLDRINRYLKPTDSILLIGCQNCYWSENYGEIAQDYFRSLGHTVKSIDIYECNGADVMDLRDNLKFEPEYDLVLNHGTQEHVHGSLYQPFKNHHEACKLGGIMIFENPKTQNWPFHGEHYFTQDFYTVLAFLAGYEIKELTEEAAMGNVTDGWNVCAVLAKAFSGDFITEEQFNQIYNDYLFSK